MAQWRSGAVEVREPPVRSRAREPCALDRGPRAEAEVDEAREEKGRARAGPHESGETADEDERIFGEACGRQGASKLRLLLLLLHHTTLAHVSLAPLPSLSSTHPTQALRTWCGSLSCAPAGSDRCQPREPHRSDAPPSPPPSHHHPQPTMSNTLEQLKKYTTVVSDSGDFECASALPPSLALSLGLGRPPSVRLSANTAS